MSSLQKSKHTERSIKDFLRPKTIAEISKALHASQDAYQKFKPCFETSLAA